jgi:hypothetical protein
MEKEEHASLLAPGQDRPPARDAAELDAEKLDIGGDRPDRADFVDPRPPFGPSLGRGLELNNVWMTPISLAAIAFGAVIQRLWIGNQRSSVARNRSMFTGFVRILECNDRLGRVVLHQRDLFEGERLDPRPRES